MVTHGCNTDIANRSLELDERVGLVVSIGWASLTTGTKVGVVADGTLISVALNVCLGSACTGTERTITVDAVVASLSSAVFRQCGRIEKSLVDWDKSVLRVNEARIDDACGAVIPIWAIEALVTDTIDVLGCVSLKHWNNKSKHTLSQPSQMAL